jgi:hypothetical protein
MGVKIDELIPDSKISDELIPNGSVEPVPIDKSCRLYSIWHTFELIPNGRVGLVQPPRKIRHEKNLFSELNLTQCVRSSQQD